MSPTSLGLVFIFIYLVFGIEKFFSCGAHYFQEAPSPASASVFCMGIPLRRECSVTEASFYTPCKLVPLVLRFGYITLVVTTHDIHAKSLSGLISSYCWFCFH